MRITRHLALAVLALSLVTTGRAATNMAASASQADVQAAVDLSSNGDTVQVPAGAATWTVNIGAEKSLHIVGAGRGVTIITNNASGVNGVLMQFVNQGAGYSASVSGFTFVPLVTNAGYSASSVVTFLGQCSAVRVYNCEFLDLNNQAVQFANASFGVVDHCYFRNHNTGNPASGVTVYDGGIGGETGEGGVHGGYGDLSWSTNWPVLWGQTNDFVYVEHCVFDFIGTSSVGQYVNDYKWGSRMVFRYNFCTNGCFQSHPTVARERGGIAFEYYGNTNIHTGEYTNDGSAIWLTSGSGVAFSNVFVGWASGITFVNDRSAVGSDYSPWGPGNGQNPWDWNTNGLIDSGTFDGTNNSYFVVDSTKTWTPGQFIGGFEIQNTSLGGTNTRTFSLILSNTANTIYLQMPVYGPGYVCHWTNGQTYAIYQTHHLLDQIGSGGGHLVKDISLGSGQPSNTVTHSISFPNQAIAPVYWWGNTRNGLPYDLGVNWSCLDQGYYTQGADNNVMLGRDYTNAVKSNYTPLVDPHPLVQADTNVYFTVTVVNGTGSGTYVSGTSVTISATNTAPTQFTGWTESGGQLSNALAAVTFYPATNNATFTGNYSSGSSSQPAISSATAQRIYQ